MEISWEERNPEVAKKIKQREYEKNKLDYANRNLINNYGISLSEYDSLFELQNGRCAICKEPETTTYRGVTKRLAVDHCHASGKIRGLLCNNCNRGIDLLKDSTEILSSALSYLQGV